MLETLEPLLAEFCVIESASDKRNQTLRFFDMLYHFFRYGLIADKIIIDVYSTKAFNFAYLLSLLSAFFKKKYILFLHGGNLPERYNNSPKKVSKIFSNAHKIIAPSLYLKSFFLGKGFNVEHIPNIIELDKYPFLLREDIRPHLMAIRGFGKPYNPMMTLQAVNKLKLVFPDLKLLMLGNSDEYYYNDVINFIEINQLQDVVTIQSKCSRDEWVAISKDYDIMISNPTIDNTPISLIEGMALGMCIISTNVGGVPYLLTDNVDGIVVENDSVKQLVLSIENLIVLNKKYLSKNARSKAEQFSWVRIRPQWIKLINDI